MQMLYNSDSFAVLEFDLPAPTSEGSAANPAAPSRGGYEIVDKHARKEIYIEGVLAESFKAGVQALVDNNPTPEAFDEYIGRFTTLAQQPLVMH